MNYLRATEDQKVLEAQEYSYFLFFKNEKIEIKSITGTNI